MSAVESIRTRTLWARIAFWIGAGLLVGVWRVGGQEGVLARLWPQLAVDVEWQRDQLWGFVELSDGEDYADPWGRSWGHAWRDRLSGDVYVSTGFDAVTKSEELVVFRAGAVVPEGTRENVFQRLVQQRVAPGGSRMASEMYSFGPDQIDDWSIGDDVRLSEPDALLPLVVALLPEFLCALVASLAWFAFCGRSRQPGSANSLCALALCALLAAPPGCAFGWLGFKVHRRLVYSTVAGVVPLPSAWSVALSAFAASHLVGVAWLLRSSAADEDEPEIPQGWSLNERDSDGHGPSAARQ